jgi:Rrf2 family iron-sulfur cluster assembly transcriptional regulator
MVGNANRSRRCGNLSHHPRNSACEYWSIRKSTHEMLHQKTTQNAIAAMSRLSELYPDGQKASSSDIAKARNLAQPLVAKVLTTLARAGLITGSPGPGGGYQFAREPREVSLLDVVSLFEREQDTACPFGPGWCGSEEPCPLHQSLLAMKQIETDYLTNTTFDVFGAYPNSKRRTSQKRK